MSFDVTSIFGAIETIVNKRLDGVSFDSTIICTIVDDSDKEHSRYIVSDGSVRFDAYTNDTSYKVDDMVRVSVLNGDFSQRKFIVGEYIGPEADSPVTYIPPLATSLAAKDNLIDEFNSGVTSGVNIDTFQLTTNSTRKKELWRVNLQDNEEYKNLQANGIYNVITLSADFKTALGDLKRGGYGLRLDLLIQTDLESESYIHRFITLDSSEMLGNPHSFGIYTNQGKRINIVSGGTIVQMALCAYEGVSFDDNNVEIPNPFEDLNGQLLAGQKIYIKNVVVAFGSDLTKVENGALQLYTTDSVMYTYGTEGEDNNPANTKHLAFTWYNKTEDDQYVGFADGLSLKNQSAYDYDEIAYNKINKGNVRLIQQQGQSGIPSDEESLTLAANIAEAKPLMVQGYNAVAQTLNNALQNLKYQLIGTTFLDGNDNDIAGINPLIKSDGVLSTKAKEAQEAADKLSLYYKTVLSYGYKIQNGESAEWDNIGKKDGKDDGELLFDVEEDYLKIYLTAINDALDAVEDFLTKFYNNTAADKDLSGYRGIYDIYQPRIMNVVNNIRNTIDQIPIEVDAANNSSDFSKLENYDDKDDYRAYEVPDLTEYANQYCVYWYRYNKNYNLQHMVIMSENEWNALSSTTRIGSTYSEYQTYCNNMNEEYAYANFAGPGWERITDKDNFGLPIGTQDTPVTKEEEVDGSKKTVTYLPARSLDDCIYEVNLNPKTKEEKFKVILFYNHNKIESNEVVFTNKDAFKEETLVDATDMLLVEHHQSSQEHYSAYNELHGLSDVRDGNTNRLIKCSYDGLFAQDEALIDAGVYWYIPVESTMLDYDLEYLKSQGFSTDAELTDAQKAANEHSRSGFVYFYKQVGETTEKYKELQLDGSEEEKERQTSDLNDRIFTYKIKSFYEQSAQNNTIEVWAYIPGYNEPVKGEIFFTFSISGTSGTKYTLSIAPKTSQIAALPYGSNSLELGLNLYDANGEKVEITNTIVNNNGTTTKGYNLSVQWYGYSNPNYNIVYDAGGGTDVTIQIVAQNNTITDPPDAITDHFIGILEVKVKIDLNSTSGSNPKDLTTLYPVAFATDTNYYIQGATALVYNNAGTVSRLNQNPYKLFKRQAIVKDTEGNDIANVSGDPEQTVEQWDIVCYNEKGDLIDSNDFMQAYVPKMNRDKTLSAAPLYLHSASSSDQYIPVVRAWVKGDDGEAYIAWTQPIVITQNRHASSILNDWDESLQIDEDNGTILATMIGAGRKNENNAFEGVLMGDVLIDGGLSSSDVPNNASGIGLYGFHDGAQSFYFGIDGKAFLGKSSKGRVWFDGNDGFIYSGNWLSSFGSAKPFENLTDADGNIIGHTLKPGTAGLALDLNNGHIDAYNFKVTSNNIYLNSNPPDEGYYFRIGNNGQQIDDAHTDQDERDQQASGQSTRGYMSFSKDGELDIRVNSLSITGQLGGINLLQQTEPKRTIPTYVKEGDNIVPNVDSSTKQPRFDWNVAKKKDYNAYKTHQQSLGLEPMAQADWNNLSCFWTTDSDLAGSYTASGSNWSTNYWNDVSLGNKKNYIAVTGSGTQTITQRVEVQPNEHYTVSGYVHNIVESEEDTLTVNLTAYKSDGTAGEFTTPQWSTGHNTAAVKNTWEKFEHTIKTGDDIAFIDVTFTCPKNFALWHAKFESGAISSAWSPAPEDTADDISSSKDKYDIYLSQDVVFDKLITDDNGQKMVGIWLLPGEDTASGHNELYINASYIATGILRSSNWDGSLQAKSAIDSQGRTVASYEIKDQPTQGMYLNLNEGKMWSTKFELNAWDLDDDGISKDKGLYINSHPYLTGVDSKYQYYLKLGDLNKSYITFASDGAIDIRANEFSLLAPFGGKNLLHQTSPRKSTLVHHWLPYTEETEIEINSVAGADGTITDDKKVTDGENKWYESIYPSTSSKTSIYTWTVDKWLIREDGSNRSNNTADWSFTTQYNKNNYTKHHGTIWKASQAIASRSNPPGNNNSWSPYVTVINDNPTSDKPYALQINKDKTEVYQTILLLKNKKYTISGYVKASTADENFSVLLSGGCTILNFALEHDSTINTSNSLKLQDTDWKYFECTFQTPQLDDNTTFDVGFKYPNPYNLWHVKLEQGSVATAWSMAEEDIEENEELLEENYNNYLNQDTVFTKLFTDPKTGLMTDGIQLVPASETLSGRPELYINASYITTGILRSKNWNGKLKSVKNGNHYDLSILRNPTQGMYINLDAGKIWAANFELNAGNDGESLYLNSSPEVGNHYLKIGNRNNYIHLKKLDTDNNTELAINSEVFTLTAGSVVTEDGVSVDKTITINSEATTYPLKIGSKFSVDWYGKMVASGAEFTGAIKSNSTITGTAISGGSITGSSITIGDNFKVTNEGVLTAKSGTIGGWNINEDSLTGGNITLNKNGTISGGSGNTSFSVGGSTGYLQATGSKLTTLTVSSEATFTDTCKVKVEGKMGINTDVPTTYDLAVDGDVDFKADMRLSSWGKIRFGPSDTDYITTSTGGELHVHTSYFYVDGDHVKIEGSIGIGGNPYSNKPGSIRVAGDVFYIGNIHCGESGVDDTGVDGTVTYAYGGLFNGKKQTLTFKKGILVKASAIDPDDDQSISLPSQSGKAGSFLQTTGAKTQWIAIDGYTRTAGSNNFGITKNGDSFYTTIADFSTTDPGLVPESGTYGTDYFLSTGGWAKLGALAYVDDIKKKFNLTLTGKVPQATHGYYVLDNAEGIVYTPIGTKVTGTNLGDKVTGTNRGDKVTGTNLGTAITRCKRGSKLDVGTFSSDSIIYYNGQSTYSKSVKGIKCNNPKYEYGTDETVYTAGSDYTLYKSGSSYELYKSGSSYELYEAGTEEKKPTYKEAGELTFTLAGTSAEVTFGPSEDDTESIDVPEVTNATVTIS